MDDRHAAELEKKLIERGRRLERTQLRAGLEAELENARRVEEGLQREASESRRASLISDADHAEGRVDGLVKALAVLDQSTGEG